MEVVCRIGTYCRKVERVGPAYLNSKKKQQSDHIERSESDEKLLNDDFEVDVNYLKSLDPKEWKNQDHYKILGLEKLR